MKNIKTLLQAIFLLFLIGCNGNDYEQPDSFTDLAWTASYGSSTTREISVEDFNTFMDLSVGSVSRTWTIPEGTFFLEGPIPNNLDDHNPYIINPGATTSSDRTVHVLFKEGNSNTVVNFHNEFADSTSFSFPAYWDTSVTPAAFKDTILFTKKVGDKWIMEYDIVLDVYDTIVPDLEIRDMNDNILDHKTLDTIYVTFGDELIFKDLTGADLEKNNARPTRTSIRLSSIEKEGEEEQSFGIFNSILYYDDPADYYTNPEVYNTLNTETVVFDRAIGNFKCVLASQRERTEDLDADSDVYDVPVVFKVSPLDEDFTQTGTVIELDDDRIVIPFSSKFNPIEGDVRANFTVKVDNIERSIASVTSAALKVDDVPNTGVLIITLDTALIPTDKDKVTVSYDGANADIKSLDNRPLLAFGNIAVGVYVPTPILQTGTIIETSDDKIQIKFNQDIDPASINGSATPEAGFIIDLNGGVGTISSVSINADNSKILELTLAEGVYRNDVITVAYTGPGDIRSVGNGIISDFVAKPVIMNEDDLLMGIGDFEGDFSPTWTDANGNGGADTSVTFVEPTTPIAAQSGTKVAHFQAIDGKKTDLRTTTNITFEAGKTYVLKYNLYVNAANTTGVNKIYYGGTQIKTTIHDWSKVAQETWVTQSVEFTPTATTNTFIRFQPIPPGVCDAYVDDLIVQIKSERP